jgi:hypothetical protein
MIVQIVLSAGLAVLAVYAFMQRSRSPLVAWTMLLVCVFAEALVLAPDLSNDLAHFAGVGRGADLIMYCFIVATLGLILNLHLRLHAMVEDITELASNIALQTAQRPRKPGLPDPSTTPSSGAIQS